MFSFHFNRNTNCSEPAINAGIRAGGEARSDALRCLYRLYFSGVQNYVVNNNGHAADAEDVFQETLVILLQQVVNKKTEIRSFKAWIITVAKRQWLMTLRRRKKESAQSSGVQDFADAVEEPFIPLAPGEEADPLTRIYLDCLRELDDKKRTILTDFFGNGKKQEELAAEHGYANAESLKQLIMRWKNALRVCAERKLNLR